MGVPYGEGNIYMAVAVSQWMVARIPMVLVEICDRLLLVFGYVAVILSQAGHSLLSATEVWSIETKWWWGE